MIVANVIASILVLVGTLNWGLVGIFDWNLVTAIFGSNRAIGAMIIYNLILLAGIWLVIDCVLEHGKISYKKTNKIR